MVKLVRFAVNNPVTTLMIFLSFILIGAVSLMKLKIDLFPEIEPPVVSILTSWYGASASDVESEVTRKIEDEVIGVNNLDRITSKSLDSLSLVQCKFEWGTDLDVATNDIRDKLELAKRKLPKDIEPPILFKFSSATAPILYISITGDKSWPRLYRIVDRRISDELKRVPGVGAILLYGGLRRRINVYFDLGKLQSYRIPISQVNKILASENINIPAGSIKEGLRELFIRFPARFSSVKDMERIIVGYYQGKPVYLRDVAHIEDGYEPEELMGWGDGKKAVVMILQKQTGKNTVEVIKRVKEKLRELKKTLPSDVKISIVTDMSEDIITAIKNLRNTLLIGIILVVVITFLFLRELKASLIISLTIPFSLIIAFIMLYLFGYTINLISLMSLAIACGMVVDNAIVILENIVRHMERGGKPIPSSIFGASEMGTAIMASTLTTVVVFVPLMFVKGFVGIMLKQLGFAIIVTLLGSLFSSLTLTPMLASRWLVLKEKGYGFLEKIESSYRKILSWSINHPLKVFILAIAVFISSLSFLPFISTSFLPEVDVGDVSVSFRLEEGTRIEETARVIRFILSKIDEVVKPEEMRHSFAWAGRTKRGEGEALGFEEGTNVGEVGFKLVRREKRKRSAKEIANLLREKIAGIPGTVKLVVRTQDPVRAILSGSVGKPIVVEVQGSNLKELVNFSKKLASKMKKVPGLVDVDISQKDERPELWVKVDREKIATLGLNVGDIAMQVRNYFYGVEASDFKDAGDFFDIFTRLTEKDKNRLENLPEVPIFTRDGRMIKLKNIARIEYGYGPVEIERKNRQRIVKVEADKYGISLGEAKRAIEKILKNMEIPPGIAVGFGGEIREQQKAFRDLILMFILGFILVYMVMASLFESLRDPFIIMFSVPFALSGVLYAFYLTHTTLGIISFMGIIMLIGIVVNNAIVLLDYIHLLRKRGYDLKEAVVEGGSSRLRPVLMTTLTTIFGMLPLALSRAQGAEIWNPMGITMLGGLALSTLITLVLIPTVYYTLEKRK